MPSNNKMLTGYNQHGQVVMHHDAREGILVGTVNLGPVAGDSLIRNFDDSVAQKHVFEPHRELKPRLPYSIKKSDIMESH